MTEVNGQIEVALFRHLDGRLTHMERVDLLKELINIVNPPMREMAMTAINECSDDTNRYQLQLFRQHASAFVNELIVARSKFGPMASAHEGYAVILEELDELKAIVWQRQSERDYAAMRKEIVHVGAMALAFLIEIVETENRR